MGVFVWAFDVASVLQCCNDSTNGQLQNDWETRVMLVTGSAMAHTLKEICIPKHPIVLH